MPRFVVLEHDGPESKHYDLMLEGQNALWTWSFLSFPESGSACERLFDHRMEYLDYEGDVSDGRGTVKRVACGTFDMLSMDPEQVFVTLRSDRLRGNCRLTRTDGDEWRFECD